MKKFILYLLFGIFFGLVCAYMATIRKPIPITEWILIAAVYNRALIGVSLYFLEEWKEKYNRWVISALAGFFISLALALPWGSESVGFGIFGAIYALLIEWIVRRFFP